MDPMTLRDLAGCLDAPLLDAPDPDAVVRCVTTDSRAVPPDAVFWGIRGSRHDGSDFAADASCRGASVSVVSATAKTTGCGPRIVVSDPLAALTSLAHQVRSRYEGLVIGVTGSVGKTTTRDMLHMILSTAYEGLQSERNFNNDVGVPLTLLRLARQHEFAVLELGARQAGEIARLCQIVQPEVGVVTCIGETHLESFGSLETIAQTKWELVDALPPNGFAVLNGDDPHLRALASRAACRVVWVGTGNDGDYRAERVCLTEDGLQFSVDGHEYLVPVFGRHLLTSCLCALAVATEIGLSPQQIAEGFRRVAPLPGRGQRVVSGGCLLIDESYNASPPSVRAAIAQLAEVPCRRGGRRILVLGDMLELGPTAAAEHFALGQLAAEQQIDQILAVGEHADAVLAGAQKSGLPSHNLASLKNLDVLLALLDCSLEPGDVVLVKGSRSMGLERVVEWFQQVFGPLEPQKHVLLQKACA